MIKHDNNNNKCKCSEERKLTTDTNISLKIYSDMLHLLTTAYTKLHTLDASIQVFYEFVICWWTVTHLFLSYVLWLL